jgi:hypothetical protein
MIRNSSSRGFALTWVVLLCLLALHCSHVAQADASQAGDENPGERVAKTVKTVGISLSGDVITVFPETVPVKQGVDILIFRSSAGPLSIQFKDDNNPFPDQPDCHGPVCIMRNPATRLGIYPYSVMVRGKTKDPRVEVQP